MKIGFNFPKNETPAVQSTMSVLIPVNEMNPCLLVLRCLARYLSRFSTIPSEKCCKRNLVYITTQTDVLSIIQSNFKRMSENIFCNKVRMFSKSCLCDFVTHLNQFILQVGINFNFNAKTNDSLFRIHFYLYLIKYVYLIECPPHNSHKHKPYKFLEQYVSIHTNYDTIF